jgi:hypothetical protein
LPSITRRRTRTRSRLKRNAKPAWSFSHPHILPACADPPLRTASEDGERCPFPEPDRATPDPGANVMLDWPSPTARR